MKDWTLSTAAVVLLAVAIGLGFYWIYPTVEPSAELAALFAFVALVLRLVAGKLFSLLRRPREAAKPEPRP